jgi:hypothetical protein
MASERFIIVGSPATEEWCGDCDDDPPEVEETIKNQDGSAMMILEGTTIDEQFAVCKRHVDKLRAAGLIVPVRLGE